ncbi:hypothetical protein CBER1_09848 [Cercospora berteroae]|uniref:Heterokaryon incompatibility domain-containing protein n=1 Tax=Cercospora berteroae TaxID=357750 RepID=A0A2S6BXY6_9PEZI|nr:hypothetical protein CBER1_09848 [Cercospora berteroae]
MPSQRNTELKRPDQQCPRLLIRIGATADDLRIEQAGTGRKKYAALSYCWGRPGSLTLVRENYIQLTNRLPWMDLAKTHQDAIAVSRELGIEYLWIDALCIIQDEPEQQTAEIKQMATIYVNAYVTLAASSSEGGQVGFLRARKPTLTVSVTLSDGAHFEVFAREVVSHRTFDQGWDAIEDTMYYHESNDAEITTRYPLFGRGWAWQERLLSPRVLHFTDTEVVWECLDSISCECGTMEMFVGNRVLSLRRYISDVPRDIDTQPEQLARDRALADKYDMLDLPMRGHRFFRNGLRNSKINDYAFMHACIGRPPTEFFTEGKSAHYDRWRGVISQYSRRKLTFGQDIFAAVSGLASMWHAKRENEGRYFAGLWEADLLRGLLWTCTANSDNMNVPRPKHYLAPSWSWASVRRPLDWLSSEPERTMYHASILDVVCVTSTGDPFGTVSDGSFIDVTGHALKATITSCREKSTTAFVFIDYHNHAFTTDCHPEVQALIGQEVLCLLWATENIDARTGQGMDRCLVLKACDTTSNTFTRVGITSSLPRGSHLFTSTEKINIRIV